MSIRPSVLEIESPQPPRTQLSLTLRPPILKQLVVNNINISERFYQLQLRVLSIIQSKTLTLESDLHLFLSLSAISLLQNINRIHEEMIPFFGNAVSSQVRRAAIETLKMSLEFPGDLLLSVIDTAQKVYNRNMDRYAAGASLFTLANNSDNNIDKRLIVSASQLLQFLPFDTVNKDISEMTLTTRYIFPILQPLFDIQEKNIRIEFTSTDLAEIDKRPPYLTGSPDCIITIFPHETDDNINIGYGEVKKSSVESDHYLVNWDLMRLAVFGKNAIDNNQLLGTLGIHIVAPFVTFYLIQLKADGLYTMTELSRIQFPMSIMEVTVFISILKHSK